jgi:hypothetical protein
LRISDRVEGARVAPATPSTARAAISIPGLAEKAASTEATPNAAAPASRSRRRPIRSPRAPMVISDPASVNPYMSTIHSSWALLGRRSALRRGTARLSTVRSIAYSRHGRASTANPIHSRRVALGPLTAPTLMYLVANAGTPAGSSGERSCQRLVPALLQGPGVSVRIAEIGDGNVVATVRVRTGRPSIRSQMPRFADVHTALAQFGARGNDVGDDQVQIAYGARRRVGDPPSRP